MSNWTVCDSRDPAVVEARFPNVKDAIRAARASLQDVYVHADDCANDNPLGGTCPCKPLKFPAWIPPR